MATASPNLDASLVWVQVSIALAWAAALAAAAELGTIAYAVPFLAAAAFVTALIFCNAAQGHPYATGLLVAVVLLVLDTKFRVSPEQYAGPDWQNAMKLAAWVALLGLGGLRWRSIARLLRKPEIIFLFAYASIALVSALWSEVPDFTGAAAVGLLGYGVLACLIVTDLREETAIRLFVFALLAQVCGALIGCVVAPEIAWLAPLSDEEVYRLQGFSAHPNLLGQIAALSVSMLAIARRQTLIGPAIYFCGLALGVATILATGSRTALVALLISWGLVATRNSRFGGAIAFAAAGALVLALALAACDALPNMESLFGELSRTGKESEIMTLTGRTEIWELVWTKIKEKPLFGWGYYGTENLIVDNVNPIYASEAKHAHNMFLQSLLSVGILGSLPGFAYFLLLVCRFVTNPDPSRDQITLLVLAIGISEPGVFGLPVAAMAIFYWILAREAAKRLPAAGPAFEPMVEGADHSPAAPHNEEPRRS